MMTDAQKWLLFAGVICAGWLLYLLAPVISPFLTAALFAYLGDPLVGRLERAKLGRTAAVILEFVAMFILLLLLLLILIPLLHREFVHLVDRLPVFISYVQSQWLPRLSAATGLDADAFNLDILRQAVADNWQDVGNVLGNILQHISRSSQVFFAWLAYLLLVPVVCFYLLRDWDSLLQNLRALIPRSYEPVVVKLTGECNRVLAEFLRGQLVVMISLGLVYTIGLWICGLEFALLVGMFAGLVSFVPYLGGITGIAIAGVLAYLQFHDLWHLIYVALVFGAGQAIEGMVLSPLLVGDRIGLHPVAVIFAIMAGGTLFGFTGILLALPVAAVITVLLRFAYSRYIGSSYYAS